MKDLERIVFTEPLEISDYSDIERRYAELRPIKQLEHSDTPEEVLAKYTLKPNLPKGVLLVAIVPEVTDML